MGPLRLLVTAGVIGTLLGVGAPATPAEREPGSEGSFDPRAEPTAASLASGDRAPGPLGLRRFRVDLGNVVDIGAPARAEFTSEVTVPVGGTGTYPLAVFLHGAHPSCFTRRQNDDGWPCRRGARPIPSFTGYRYVADRLASHGIASVSLSANGVNGQEGSFSDGGTAARALLVRRHLAAIDAAARGGGDRYPARFARQVDLDRVLLVGHSRGVAAVVQTATEARYRRVPYTVRAVVSLAGTTQVKQAAPGVPLLALLPQCDADVFDLESQLLVDEGARLPGDTALRTAVWVPGANHNFLNTQWTPGLSVARSWNDAAKLDDWNGPCHRGKRITSGAERRVARAYVGVMAARYLLGDTSVTRFVDGSPARPEGLGSVRTRATATQGGARLLQRQWRGRVIARRLTAVPGRALRSAERVGWTDVQTPHWLPALEFPEHSTRQRALMVRWTRHGGMALSRLGRPVDLTGAARVQLRVAVDNTTWRTGRVALALRDSAGRTARVDVPGRQLVQLGRGLPRNLWAQSVSVAVRAIRRQAPRLDLRRIAWLGLAARGGSGRVWILDAWATRPGPPPAAAAGQVSVILAGGSATWQRGRFRVRLVVTSATTAPRPTAVRYNLATYHDGPRLARGTITLPAGARRGSLTLRSGVAKRDSRLILATYPDRWGVNLTDYVWLKVR